MLSQSYNMIINQGVSTPEHDIEVTDGINSTHKRFLLQLIAKVQLLGLKGYDIHIVMKSATHNTGVGLVPYFQKHLYNA